MSVLPDGWRALPAEEIAIEYEARHPILAMWVGPGPVDVTIYTDGAIEADGGTFPVELLPHVSLAWHGHLRGKVA